MQPFFYDAHPVRVISGLGTLAQLPAEVERRRRDFMVLPGKDPKELTKPENASRCVVLRPDFHVAATAKSPEGLHHRFDEAVARLPLTTAAQPAATAVA